jgi:hypothetical protein
MQIFNSLFGAGREVFKGNMCERGGILGQEVDDFGVRLTF